MVGAGFGSVHLLLDEEKSKRCRHFHPTTNERSKMRVGLLRKSRLQLAEDLFDRKLSVALLSTWSRKRISGGRLSQKDTLKKARFASFAQSSETSAADRRRMNNRGSLLCRQWWKAVFFKYVHRMTGQQSAREYLRRDKTASGYYYPELQTTQTSSDHQFPNLQVGVCVEGRNIMVEHGSAKPQI